MQNGKNQLNDELLKYRNRVVWQAVLKAFLYGIVIGCGAAFVAACVSWFLPINGLWLSLGIALGVIVVSTPILYFWKFRPDQRDIARRVDRELGLAERAVTMLEYAGDDSYMAIRQRADASESLRRGNVKNITFRISMLLVILLAVFGFCGTAMTTVTALSAYGVIPNGSRVIGGVIAGDRENAYSVEYFVDDDSMGYIVGEDIQIVSDGETTSKVVAEARDGFVFVQWSDGLEEVSRTDVVDGADLEFIAYFAEVGDGDGDGDGDGEGEEGDQGGEPGEGDSNGDGDQQGDGQQGSPGQDDGSNNIIDGETDYRVDYDTYYQDAMQFLAENPDLPDYLQEIVEAYFNILS